MAGPLKTLFCGFPMGDKTVSAPIDNREAIDTPAVPFQKLGPSKQGLGSLNESCNSMIIDDKNFLWVCFRPGPSRFLKI